MQAGERDPAGLDTFESLDSDILIRMYKHCDFLEYESLKKHIFHRLKSIFDQSLPTVDEIKLYQTSIPTLYDHSIRCLVQEMVMPWTHNYEPYIQLAKTNEAFGQALNNALQKTIALRVKVSEEYYRDTKNRRVIWAIKYIKDVRSGHRSYPKFKNMSSWRSQQKDNAALGRFNNFKVDTDGARGAIPALATKYNQKQPSTAHAPLTCHKCSGEGHMARNYRQEKPSAESTIATGVANKKMKQRLPTFCYLCKGTDHFARNCTSQNIAAESAYIAGFLKKITETRPPQVCYQCSATEHIARNCTQESPQSEKSKAKSKGPFVCYKCSEEGHMARECQKEVLGNEHSVGGLDIFDHEFR